MAVDIDFDFAARSGRVQASARGKLATLVVRGRLESADYEEFVPRLEQMIDEHGRISLLVELVDFHGWTAGGLWEDVKFDARHFNDIERLAVVGDKAWEKGMALFCRPFTTAKVRYFDVADREEARNWVAGED